MERDPLTDAEFAELLRKAGWTEWEIAEELERIREDEESEL